MVLPRISATTRLALPFIFVVVSTTTSGCAFLERNTIGLFRRDSKVESGPFQSTSKEQGGAITEAPAQAAVPPARGEIEVVWQVPAEKVDSYILRYGYAPDQLNEETSVVVSTLTPQQDPKAGPVYRYRLSGVETDRTLYVTLIAKSGATFSAPSEVFKVIP